MPYIICNENNYLVHSTEGCYITQDINKATKWKKIQTANNAYDNIKKKFQDYCLSVRYVNQENKIINSPAVKIELDYDILDKVKEIASFTKDLEARRLYLIEKIHGIELNIVDIEHAAEFYNLNASQGYKLYKMLHDAEVERRIYKNELKKIEYAIGTPICSKNIENLERSITGLNNQKYTPRVNKELFGV